MASAGDNGGRSPDDLPDLPEEWGVIVIPDDLSELDDEVRAIRAELHLAEHPSRWQRFLRRPVGRRVQRAAVLLLRAPVLIVSLAVLVTVASLFASAWPGPPRPPATQRTSGTTVEPAATTLPALELLSPDGRPVALNADLPAVIMLIDDCDCAQLVTDTIAAVPPSIAVITVSAAAAATAAGTPPTGATPQAQGKTVRILHDPTNTVRTTLKIAPSGGTAASVLLVDKGGAIVRTLRTATVELIKPDLARL
nr:hypothetical protein [uncultured Actinoplanes sp.]